MPTGPHHSSEGEEQARPAFLPQGVDQPSSRRTAVMAQRFFRLFQDHGLSMGEISNFLPQVNLEILAHPGGLAGLLTPELLDQTAALFEVRRNWLSGKGDQIYDLRHCYK